MIKKLNMFLEKRTLTLFYLFLFMQPILDLFISLFNHYNISSNVVLIVRTLFLIYFLYYLLFIKKCNIKYLIALFIYAFIFILINLLSDGIKGVAFEIKALIKVIYFPITLLFVMELFKNNDIKKKYLYIVLLIYLLLIFVPDVLNIGFESYLYDKVGSIGLFYSANAVGNIVSMLAPLFIFYLLKNKKMISLVLFLGLYFYVLLMMGTKAPILTAMIIVLYLIILLIIKLIKEKKYNYIFMFILAFIIGLIIIIKVLPETSFYKNLIIHAKNMGVESLSDMLNFKKLDDYIFSGRLSFLKDSLDIYINQPLIQKLFGMGYIVGGKQIKTSEMDYFVMLLHQGILGFIILYYKYFSNIVFAFKKYINKFKTNFSNLEKSGIIIALIISILNALLVGHVLDVPSVSIFVAIIIVISYKIFSVKEDK